MPDALSLVRRLASERKGEVPRFCGLGNPRRWSGVVASGHDFARAV